MKLRNDPNFSFDSSKDLVFQFINWYTCDTEYGDDFDDDDDDCGPQDESRYLVKVFGSMEDGTSVAVNVLNFTPYFYVKIDHKVDNRFTKALHEYIVSKMPYNMRSSLISVKMLQKKDFWGFTNFKKFNYARLTFKNLKGFRAGIRIMSSDIKLIGVTSYPVRYKLYESNIEPFLRLMHINELQPTGWCTIKGGKYTLGTCTFNTTCQINAECKWQDLQPFEKEKIAPFVVASFDIECTSSHGDFPVARKDYRKVANELYACFTEHRTRDDIKELIVDELIAIFTPAGGQFLNRVFPKRQPTLEHVKHTAQKLGDEVFAILCGRLVYKNSDHPSNPSANNTAQNPNNKKDVIVKALTSKLNTNFPALEGDPIIQIGTTVHNYGEKQCSYKSIVTLGSCDPIEGVDVYSCDTEEELLLKWRDIIVGIDPDVILGYNIFGFDMPYVYERAREKQIETQLCKLGRFVDHVCEFKEKMLSSSALGDNILRYIDMEGRVLIDVMKVVQRDHKLDSFKLDNVAHHFLGMNKNDVHPNDIFRLQKGSSADRKVVAEYCVQDCALCNFLTMKLEILANNIGMSNVCNVPLSYIFMRGQGIKIFSLVAKECKNEDFLIPTLQRVQDIEEDDGYEGAIVLEPKTGIYIDDPVSVLDYASLYPSSMISENLSHDCIVIDSRYDNLPGVEYLNIAYDVYEGVADKKHKVGERVCRFVQLPNNEKGIIPRILMKLLRKRKETRKKAEWQTVTLTNGESYKGAVSMDKEACITKVVTGDGVTHTFDNADVDDVCDTYDDFQKAVLDGLQQAYKVTANSLYGQIGARTSQIYLKDIAACTTATGRKMILMAKDFLEKNYCANIVYGDSVTGDTPLLLRYPDGHIDIQTFEAVMREDQWVAYNNFRPWMTDIHDKQQCFIDAEVWANGKWAKIHRLIRHKTNKKLFRVNTMEGSVDVTEDHSLLDVDCNEIKPKDCVVGETQLLHSFPDEFPEIKMKMPAQGVQEIASDVSKTCSRCNTSYPEDMFYANHKNKEGEVLRRDTRCKLCIKKHNCERTGKEFSGLMEEKILKYYVPEYTITKEEAWVWGMFFGDGSCGYYECKSGDKYSWAINNSNLKYLEIVRKYLRGVESESVVRDFVVLDTLNSSGVYKLVPSGSIKYMVEKYRNLFYDKDDYKKVPALILNAPKDIRLWFMRGYLTADGNKAENRDSNGRYHNGIQTGRWSFACLGKIGAQGLYYLMKSLGWKNIRVNIHEQKENTYWIYDLKDDSTYFKQGKNTIQKMFELNQTNPETYVYDIETQAGLFHASVGAINVKNTDSIFVVFPKAEPGDETAPPYAIRQKGHAAIMPSIQLAIKASNEFKSQLKAPHDLEYEKTFYPFILLSKKRYVANKYEQDDKKCKQNSMGIVLKRRDNANIVKKVYGGIIDTILNEQDVKKSLVFLQNSLNDLVEGKYPIEDLVITKSLKAEYKDPEKIAHKILADRIKERDPGNAPNVNDRIPFVYIQTPTPEKKGTKILQGERIETPDYIKSNRLKPDYEFYITNQIMNPVLQVYALALDQLPGYRNKDDVYWEDLEKKVLKDKDGDLKKTKDRIQDLREDVVKELLFDPILTKLKNKRVGNREITDFFKVVR